MRANSPIFFTVIILAIGGVALKAQTSPVVVNTVPEGAVTLSIPMTHTGQSSTNYLSMPLSSDPIYTGAVFSVTTDTITIADSPAPWTTNQFADTNQTGTPYFVKFLSGVQAGRVILIKTNTANSVTLDTTDNSSQIVALNTSGFSVVGATAGPPAAPWRQLRDFRRGHPGLGFWRWHGGKSASPDGRHKPEQFRYDQHLLHSDRPLSNLLLRHDFWR